MKAMYVDHVTTKQQHTLIASFPVRATMRLMPLEIASSVTMANDSMWPARCRWLESRNKSDLLPVRAVGRKRPVWRRWLTFLHRTQRNC